MNEFDLLVDLHKYNQRQGPGSPRETKKAIELTGLTDQKNLEIADIGCGTGLSEITWTTDNRPDELEQFWKHEYPEIDTVPGKLKVLKSQGYETVAHFILPENCWTDHYYLPLQESYKPFLERQKQSQEAIELVAIDRSEFEMYKKYSQFYSYGFYIARKL
ncbi:MAG: hypothetical protein K8R52_07945 [Bacteroidales bacterium]|nr:hypothetical protein [Bacteroidales bacterium]